MRVPGRIGRVAIALAALLALGACDPLFWPPEPPGARPQARPAGLRPPAPTPPAEPSARSRELAAYYARVEADLVAQGLLRTDGGGPDTPFTDAMLARHFERIALAEEYERGAGLRPSSGSLGPVKKWTEPVRLSAEFGASVPPERREADRADLGRYAERLTRVTGHPIALSDRNPNFHVLFMGEDDRDSVVPRIRAIVPEINPASLAIFDRLPRAIHCLVIAFAKDPRGYEYGRAIAFIRDEHPNLLRRACIHEEVAQGLGLANDAPEARPSIFNDDDEFALLTTHDELLLRILYDPMLRPGMSAEAARPIVRRRASQLLAGAGRS